MSDSEKLRQIIRFEVDPAPFGEDTEENPFFDVDKYKGYTEMFINKREQIMKRLREN